jgi:hypothetical protein
MDGFSRGSSSAARVPRSALASTGVCTLAAADVLLAVARFLYAFRGEFGGDDARAGNCGLRGIGQVGSTSPSIVNNMTRRLWTGPFEQRAHWKRHAYMSAKMTSRPSEF